MCECLFSQFPQADPYVTLFANSYNLEVCSDVDDFEVPTSIDGSCDWSLCSHSNAIVANFNTFDCQSLVDEVCRKYQFFDVDERELENVIKGGCRANKTNMLSFGPRTHLMNGENPTVMIQKNPL